MGQYLIYLRLTDSLYIYWLKRTKKRAEWLEIHRKTAREKEIPIVARSKTDETKKNQFFRSKEIFRSKG